MANPSDNTFATAVNVGTFTGRRAQTFILRGTVGPSDPIDHFKITFRSRSAYASARDVYQVRGGSVALSTYLQNRELTQNRILFASAFRLPAGRSVIPSNTPFLNSSTTDTVFYIRVTRPSRALSYVFRITLTP